ncbi:hypothetical protein XMM379_000641 [Aliiroseovarius sp. xm-m-379]|uniref:hypothetical protein n=1 Tax=Aliiroseovarius TaxID=1658781 RepID=UPI001569495D|nr:MULTISPECIES: hypothetical protein [Aliiroseovarius]NRP13205.1 hypothetical protein [Aliiroseovarius sp. xm-d-517]NRP23963.1 hypothetical protein [Aliiroseovarius sp. xm-m-379]NRP30227.1 hypothetical protein [Aliiroseovarius sp. xm-m-314]NRP32762.1 hypothetical protein [Aliiroseovarius sp. xm-a-104]NRP40320.1 hypothetical protein [Aliiroseovarius sp. xm-m-339-2]
MSEISKLAELRKLLLEMEKAIGIQDLSATERDLFYAASDLSLTQRGVKTTNLQSHSLVANISRPTFFRTLKSLVNKGYLRQLESVGKGHYEVKSPE